MHPWTFGGDPQADLEKICTPAFASARGLAQFLNADPRQVLAVHLFKTDATGPALSSGVNPAWIVAVIRGDQQLDAALLDAAAHEYFNVGLRAPAETAATESWPIAHLGPHAAMKAANAVLIVDPNAAQPKPWITGANEPGAHIKNFNWFRECGDRLADPRKTAVAEIASRVPGG